MARWCLTLVFESEQTSCNWVEFEICIPEVVEYDEEYLLE